LQVGGGGPYIADMRSKLSHSALGTFRNCPRQFKFAYVDKVPVPRKLYAYNHLGNAVHRQLKTAYQWAAEGRLYPLDAMLRGFEAEWEGPVREKIVPSSEHTTVDTDIANGWQMLERFHERYQPFDQGTLLLAERRLDFDLPNCPVGFTSRVDRLSKMADGTVEICDYKTSRSLPAGPKDPSFRLQMGLYQLAVREAFPHFEQIEISQYYLRHDEVIRCRLRPDELDELAEQFRTEALDIARAERLDDWPPKESGLCRFCDYARLCPVKRHQFVREEEDDDETRATYQEAAELADTYAQLDHQEKQLKRELNVLKEQITAAARDLGVGKLQGSVGQVTVSIRPTEKLPTRTENQERYAELSALVRSWDEGTRDICLKLDSTAVLGLYRRRRLTEDQWSELDEFVSQGESVRVSAKLSELPDEDEESDEA